MPNNESFVWGLIPFIRDIGRIDRTTRKDITDNGEFVTKGIDLVDVNVPAPAEDITPEEQEQIVTEEKF